MKLVDLTDTVRISVRVIVADGSFPLGSLRVKKER